MPNPILDPDALRIRLNVRTTLAVVGTIIAATFAVSLFLNRIDSRLTYLQNDQYGMARAAEVALRTAIENPKMRVVDPRDPSRPIIVYGNYSTESILPGIK